MKIKSKEAKPKNSKKSKEKEKPWKSFSKEEYQELDELLVHFSFKSVNTNSRAGGIRLSPVRKLKLPYISLQTLQAEGECFELDYITNVKTNAAKTAQLSRFVEGKNSILEGTAEERKFLQEVSEAIYSSGKELNTDVLDPRLRQILLPHFQHSYISVTPLPSASFCLKLNVEKNFYLEQNGIQKEKRLFYSYRRSVMGYGGSNSQNAGRLIREMQTSLPLSFPIEDEAIRKAYALHYSGIQPRITRKQMEEYRHFRKKVITPEGIFSNMKLRAEEKQIFTNIVAFLLHQGEEAYQFLVNYKTMLPAEDILSKNVEIIAQGMIVKEKRTKAWREALAEKIVYLLETYSGDKEGGIALNKSAESVIKGWIMEELWVQSI
jgi:hypothetical protein